METTTETIDDVIAELARLAPKGFRIDPDHLFCLSGRWVSDPYVIAHQALLTAVCLEKCEARGWAVVIGFDPSMKQWDARLSESFEIDALDLAYFDAPTLVDAITTALRDALKASTHTLSA